MKTLHFDTERVWRGGQQQLFYLLEGLQRRGLAPVLLAQPHSPLLERAREVGIDVRPFGARGEADLQAAARLARLLRDEPCDLLHCHTAHAHGVALLAFWRLPRQRHPRLVVARRVAFAASVPGWLKATRLKYRRADRIIAVSRAVREGLVRAGLAPERVAVVRDGVDVARFEQLPDRRIEVRRGLGLRDGEPMVLNVAHMGKEKGQSDLVAAAAAVRAARPTARFVLVGDGPLRPRLERQARGLGLLDAIVFAGLRPSSEISHFLKAGDVYAHPSLNEGLGSVVLDAMAAGTPVVATRVGGIPELIRDGETGLLVPARQPEALAQAILRLLDHPTLARHLAAAAQVFVREHGTSERMVEQTLSIYKELLFHRESAGAAARA